MLNTALARAKIHLSLIFPWSLCVIRLLSEVVKHVWQSCQAPTLDTKLGSHTLTWGSQLLDGCVSHAESVAGQT